MSSPDKLVSFGGSIATIKLAEDDDAHFCSRAESHQADTRIVNTHHIPADEYNMFSLENAIKFGSVTLLAEHSASDVTLT